MSSFEQESQLVRNREDLIAVLRMRFGKIDAGLIETVDHVPHNETLEQLILTAAQATNPSAFTEKLAHIESQSLQ